MTVLPTTYWGPAAWFEAYLAAHDPLIEVCDSFPKQTLRNRCIILSPAGEEIMLTVPICKVESKQLTRDIRISYQQHWPHQHWQAIFSAYKKSPYFDYYADFIRPLYEQQFRYLLDLNAAVFGVANALLKNKMPGTRTEELHYTSQWSNTDTDAFWGDKISVLDRLFNYGPQTLLLSPAERSK